MAWTEKRGKTWTGYYRDGNRDKKSKGGFARKRDAADWAVAQEQSIGNGTHVAPRAGRVTFGSWAARWQTSLSVSPRTHDTYDERLRSLILPRWESTPLDRITLTDVKAWSAGMTTRSGAIAAPMRRRNAVQLFARMLDDAVDEGMLPRNPAHARSDRKTDYLPRATTTKAHRYLTHEQLWRVANAAPEDARRLILVTGYTGLRFGEVTALRVRDVNAFTGAITVARAFTRLDNGQIIAGVTKTGRTRTVILAASLKPLIGDAVAGKRPDDLVFAATNGLPLRRDNFTARTFRSAVETARTAVATLQTALGVPASGIFDAETAAEVRRFQHASGSSVSGQTDDRLWSALRDAVAGQDVRLAARLAALRQVTLREGSEDFPTLTFHDLRHTAASLAVAVGADVKAVQGMLGHASAAMTLDVYAGLFPGALQSVADRLDEQIAAAAHNLPTYAHIRSISERAI